MPPTTLKTGPFKGVRTTNDPFDETTDLLDEATNMYFPDPSAGCGVFQRPAFSAPSPPPTGSPLRLSGITVRDTGGTDYRFLVSSGKLYRVSADLTVADDVTPVGVAIDNNPGRRIYMYSYANQLIVTDGVNRPWRGTNLSATPITGTYIDIDGAAGAWTAFGPPTMYGGCLIFIAATVPGGSSVIPRLGIVWCEPNQPQTGYTQSGYTDFANLIQTSPNALTAIWGTNNGLIYWRDSEIGMASGIVDGSFASTNTSAAISRTIGLLAPLTIGQYGETIYFCDQYGRPQRMVLGEGVQEPEMWLQLRAAIDTQMQAGGYQNALERCAVGIVEPNLNLYICAPYSTGSFGTTTVYPPNTMYVFDAKTGIYVGTWSIGSGPAALAGMWLFTDGNGALAMTVAGNNFSAGWVGNPRMMQLKRLSDADWTDDLSSQTVNVTTVPIGYSDDTIYAFADTATAITMNAASVALTVQTPYTSSTSVGTIAPATSSDGTYRVVWGMDTRAARNVRCTLTPTLTSSQWGLQRFAVIGTPSKAGREER